ncbi:Ig-like domain-containing protein [Alcanivoracaceae bacterium MT1]
MNVDVVSLNLSSSKAFPLEEPVALETPSIVKIPVAPNQVAAYTQSKNDLIVDLVDGRRIVIKNFFVTRDGQQSELVLEDEEGTLWWGHYDAGASQFSFEEIGALAEIGGASEGGHGAALILAALGAGALAHELSKGGGGPPDRDTTAPDAPTGLEYSDGTVTGNGEPGARVIIEDADGNVIGEGSVNEDGTFEVPVDDSNGGVGEVRLEDDSGNTSEGSDVALPDTLRPEAPTGVGYNDGTVTGKGEPGAKVVIKDGDGNIIGEGTVNQDGTFEVPVEDTNDGTGEVTLTDDSGNTSEGTDVALPDTVAPDAPAGVEYNDGTITGNGEPGTHVEVKDAEGNIIGEGTVNEDGTFEVPVDDSDGGMGEVTLTDDAGNTSDGTDVTLPDTLAPDAPTDLIYDDGAVTGNGEAGAAVEVKDKDGNVIGRGIVSGDGTFAVPVDDTNGGGGTVTLTDGADNTSMPGNVALPDTLAPDAPTGVEYNDGTVTGNGEPGADVEVKDTDGNVIGKGTVNEDGTFEVPVDDSNGGAGEVTQTDDSGNTSEGAGVTLPDTLAPAAPTDLIYDDGAVTGKGEAGAAVEVKDKDGNVIGRGIVNGDGAFAVPVDDTNGGGGEVTLTDGADNTSIPGNVALPDTLAPDAPTDVEYNNGTVTGNGEPGADVEVKDADGNVIGEGTVNEDGTFVVPVDDTNGGPGEVALSDDSGNTSDGTGVTLPDTLAPAAPTDLIYNDGAVHGNGEAGAAVEVKDKDGNVIGQGIVNGDGTFSVPVDDTNGGAGEVIQTDGAGLTSAPGGVALPDTLAPDAPTEVDFGDRTVTGKGEPGARVQVRDADGNLIGEGTVNEDGTFSVPVEGGVDGEGQVTLTDDADNESDGTPVAIDLTPPDAPTANIDDTGTTVTGETEPNAEVEVRDADGELIGTGSADENGSYEVSLDPPQTDGSSLAVTATDPVGNVSEPMPLDAPYVLQAFDVQAQSQIADVEPSNTLISDPEGNEISFTSLASLVGAQDLLNLLTGAIGDTVEFVVGNEGGSNSGWQIVPQDASYQFEVGSKQTADVEITYHMSGAGTANVTTNLWRRIGDTNSWEIVDQSSTQFFAEPTGLFGTGPQTWTAEDLPEGEYMVTTIRGGLANIGLVVTTTTDVKIDYSSYLVDENGNYAHIQAAEGNVFSDGDSEDIRPDDAVLMVRDAQGNYQEVTGPTEVEGEHGTLTIDPNGDFSYQPYPGAEHVGQTDEFDYALKNPNGDEMSEATLSIENAEGEFSGPDPQVPASFNALVSSEDPTSIEVIDEDGAEISFTSLAEFFGLERLVNTATTAIGKGISFVIDGDGSGDFPVLPSDGAYQFTVESGQSQDVEATFALSSGVSFGQNVTMSLLRQTGENTWEVVQTVTASSPVDLLGLGGPSGTLEQKGLGEGNYLLMLSSQSGAGLVGTASAEVKRTVREYADDGITVAASGNLVDRLDGVEAGDQLFYRVPEGTAHDREIDGEVYAVVDQEVRLYGDAGVLVLRPDGSYSYEPFPNPDNIGRVDTFDIASVSGAGDPETHELSFNILDGEVYSHLEPSGTAEQAVAEEVAASSGVEAQVSDEDNTGASDGEPLLEGDPESSEDVVALNEPAGDSDVTAGTEPDFATLALEDGDGEIRLVDEEEAGTGMEALPQADTATTLELALDTEALNGAPDTLLVEDPLKQEVDTPSAIA